MLVSGECGANHPVGTANPPQAHTAATYKKIMWLSHVGNGIKQTLQKRATKQRTNQKIKNAY
jgi:hypothetical protein